MSVHIRRFSRLFVVFVLLALPLFFLTRVSTHVPTAYAATSDNLNFQARLQTSAGAIVPDGFYNVEFKLYDDPSAGTLLWTETRYDSNGVTAGNDNRVRVVNGYLTVNLGDITAFPGSMPWDQQMYLTMNIGGSTQTATPTYDGEMTPRLKLTAVPYAFNAKTASELVKTNGALTGSLSIQSPTIGNQIFQVRDQAAAGTYNLLTENEANAGFIQLQGSTPGTAQTGNFNISGTGIASVLQASSSISTVDFTATGQSILGGDDDQIQVIVKADASQTANILEFQSSAGVTLSSFDENGQLTLGRITASGTTQAGALTIADGTTSNFGATISTETLTADRKFLLPNTTLATTASPGTICVYNGATSNCPAATGSAFYIQNQNAAAQTSATFWIDGAARADGGFIGTSLDTATGVALNIGTTNATSIVLNENTTVAAGKDFTFTAGAGSFDQSASTGTFKTGTGAISLNGDSTIAAGKSVTFAAGAGNFDQSASTGTFKTGTGAVSLNGNTTVASGKTLSVLGAATFQNATDSTNAFAINDASGASAFIVDTTNRWVGINTNSPAASLDVVASTPVYTNGFETGALTPLTTSGAGSPGWSVTSSNPATGTYHARLANMVSASTDYTMELTVILNSPGTISFDHSCAWIWSGFTFQIDAATPVGVPSCDSWGTYGYSNSNYAVGSGTHTFKWNFNSGSITGGNRIDVDNIVVTNVGTGTAAIFNGGGVGIGLGTGVQPATALDVNGDIQGSASLTLGTSSTTNGTIVLKNSTNANTVTIQSGAQTGNYTLSVPVLSGNADICTSLNNCNSLTTTSGIQNQNASAQATANYWIDGTGRADTSILTPLVDTATATTLNIGTTNATTINLNQNTVVAAGKSISLNGGNTASRPGSPTEGMLYFDTTTKQLLVYANGKWQADRSTANIIVATSAAGGASTAVASQKYDGADYVNTSDTSAQTVINSAISSLPASGGTVYLMEGTYIIDGSISLSNNVTLTGAGPATILKLKNGINADINMITNSDTTTGANVVVSNLTIEGNKTNNSSGNQYGINFNNLGSGNGSSARQGATIHNIWASNFRMGNIRLDGLSNSIISNSHITNASTPGIFLNAAVNITITGNHIQGNSRGIYGQTVTRAVITGNTIEGNSNGIWFDANSFDSIISGNVIRGSATAGVLLDGSDRNSITSNRFVDNGGTTTNEAILLQNTAIGNSITANTISDSSASSTNYAIDINDAGSTGNYLSDNTLGTGSINDAAAASNIYGGQLNASGNFMIQPAGTIELMKNTNITGTITGASSLTLGTSSTTNGTIVLKNSTNANTVTLQSAAQTGNFTLTIPVLTGNSNIMTDLTGIQNQNAGAQASSNFWISGTGRADTSILSPLLDTASAVALNIGTTNATVINLNENTSITGTLGVTGDITTSGIYKVGIETGITGTCGGNQHMMGAIVHGGILTGGTCSAEEAIYLQGGTPGTAQTGNLNITGVGIFGTAVATPLLDTATATALNIGTTNATVINLNENTVVAAGKNVTFAAGAGNFDQSASTGTFSTGTGAVSLNGDTTVASGKNFTVTSGTTSLTGTTNVNTTGSGTTTIGSVAGGAVSITANAASNFTTNTGALTLTSAAATTWSTSAGALTLQGAAGATIRTADGATSSAVTITTGNASGGASGAISLDTGTATTTAGTISIGTTNASGVTIGRATVTTTIQGSLSITPQASTSTTLLCTNAGVVSTCDAAVLAPTATNFIQNQNAGAQATSNYWISGTGRADTSILSPLLDTATATALNIGTTNATVINLNESTVVAAGKSITLAGGNTASRPGSPSEGMLYFDSDTDKLLVYSNGKWQADRTGATKTVAPNNASQAVKDSADYVATGTADQTIINTALTAAAGGKVLLLEGTFVTSDAISVPNNTTLAGSGRGTLVQFSNIATLNRNMVVNGDTSTGEGVVIRDLRLDGNSSVNTSGTQHGIYLAGVGSGASGAGIRQGATVINNWVNNFRANGIYYDGSSNGTVANNNVLYNVGDGINIDSSNRVTVSNNTIMVNSAFGVRVSGALAITVNANTIAGNGLLAGTNTGGGILFDGTSSNNAITNNSLRENGASSGTANSSIYFTNASNNSVTGNSIYDSAGTGYGINIFNGTAVSNYFADNTMVGTGATGINDAGTTTIWGGQTNASGNFLIQPVGTIELMKNTNVTGTLGVSSTLNLTGATPAIAVTTAATNLTMNAGTTGLIQIGATSTGNIELGGGSGSTGCTLTNSTGAFTCTAAVTAPTFQSAAATALTITGNAASTWSTSAGLLTVRGGGGLTLDSTSANLNLTTTTSGNIVLNSAGTINLQDTTNISGTLLVNPTNSATAFQLQRSTDSSAVLTGDSSNNRVKIGNDAASSGADVTVLVLDNATSGNVPTGLAGAMYYDSTNNKFKCYTTSWVDCDTTGGGGSSAKKVTFVPEFAGGVLKADGTNNNGTMVSDFVSGLSSGEGYKHNFYEWASSQATAQDYDVVVNHQLPSDFNASTEFDATTWKVWTYVDSNTDAAITMTVYDSDGTACANGVSIEAGTTGWQQVTLSDFDTNANCDFTADSIVTIVVRMTSLTPNTNKVRLGEIQYGYTN